MKPLDNFLISAEHEFSNAALDMGHAHERVSRIVHLASYRDDLTPENFLPLANTTRRLLGDIQSLLIDMEERIYGQRRERDAAANV